MFQTGFDEALPIYHDSAERRPNNVGDALLEHRFVEFIKSFRKGEIFPYGDRLLRNFQLKDYYLEVQMEDLSQHDDDLCSQLSSQPQALLRRFEAAAREFVRTNKNMENIEDIHPIQIILLHPEGKVLSIRELQSASSEFMGKLVQVPGIVVSMSKTQAKALVLSAVCRGCQGKRSIPVLPGFGGAELPKICDTQNPQQRKCPVNPYVISPDETTFMDQQILKLQDNPENVPTGEMPRHLQLVLDRNLVGRAVPGTRVTVMGILTIYRVAAIREVGAANIRHTYLQVVGVRVDRDGAGRTITDFTTTEIQEFQALSRRKGLYDEIAKSIAPSIYGHDDIKRAVACQLFGGCRKILPDGMRLRGDINILLLGDPGTAKSQLLKFTEKVSPIGVYTSGKGSSAAGLTASVKRDTTSREFFLEGGAMVLADGGIVCIDEFDKMRVQDRVAIHEAMEQQVSPPSPSTHRFSCLDEFLGPCGKKTKSCTQKWLLFVPFS